jgi:hypothetical protein
MNPVIHLAIIISAISLVGMAAIAVNYTPTPAHAQQCKGWLLPRSQGQICFQTKKECDAALAAAGSTLECTRSKG